MPDGAALTEASDPLVASVQQQVTELAWGNPFAKEGFSFTGTREDRTVVLTMRVDVVAKRTNQTLHGQAEPSGHTRCKDTEAAADFLAAAFAKSATSENTLGRITSKLQSNPAKAFSETPDGFDIGVVAGRSYFHVACRVCGKTGIVDCGGCNGRGTVNCYACHDGQRSCPHCSHGTIYYTERVWNYAVNAYTDENRSRNCNGCGGTGRSGSCPSCNGQRTVRCSGCGGGGTVGCGTCGRTGWLTVATTVSLVGNPVRAIAFMPDAPPGFQRSVAALTIRDLPDLHGKTVRGLVDAADGRAGLGLECVVPHIQLDASFAPGFEQRFDAVGLLARIPLMPMFLDGMLQRLSDEIGRAADEGRPEDVLRLAKETRVTCTALVAVSGREGHGLEALQHLWKGAASDEILNGFLERVRLAYDGLGASAVRRPWQMLALPVVAAPAAAFPLHISSHFLAALSAGRPSVPLLEFALNGAIGLLPFGLAFVFAGRHARRAVRALVGKDAARVPRQGWWARGVAVAAVAALVAGAVEADWASIPPVTAVYLPAAFRSQSSGAIHVSLLSPTKLPKLKPTFLVERTRGAPDIFWLQFHLRQLGFLHVYPDGIVHPSTYDALNMFNDSLPRSRKRFRPGWDAAAEAAAALRGEFPLERLAADIFPMPGLSNMARANLTGRNAVVMQTTAAEAIAVPGRETAWRDEDGTRSGRLVATLLPTGCPLLQVEVEIRGAVENAGPFPYCRRQRR